MANRFTSPFHERVSQECGALQAPMDPGFVAAPFGHRRHTRVRLQFISGAIAFTLFAERDEESGGKDRTSAWQSGKQGKIGMALGTLRDGVVEVGNRLEDAPKLGDEGLDQEGMGGDNPLIGRQRGGALDGLDACVDDVDVAHVMGAEEALQRGATRELGGFEGRPLGEEVAEEYGVLVLKPLQGVREVVFQRAGEAVGKAYFVADQTAAMFDELRKRTHGGALGVEGLQLVAMLEQELELQFGVSGVVFRMAGGEGFAVLGQGGRVDGKQNQVLVLTQGGDEGAFVEFKAHRDGASCEPLL